MRNDKNKSKINFIRKQDNIQDFNDEIIDDSALVDCICQLNLLKDKERVAYNLARQDILQSINQISAEMSWFSQWLTAKSNSAA